MSSWWADHGGGRGRLPAWRTVAIAVLSAVFVLLFLARLPSRSELRGPTRRRGPRRQSSPPPPQAKLPYGVRVWQTGPTRLDDEHTPERLRDSIQGMRLDNPDVGFEYLDDNEQRAWVVDHFPSDVVDLYDGLPNNVMRADLWRYMVIAKEGGIYLDADVYLMSPFREWQALHPTMGGDDGWGRCDVIIGMENDTHLCQWALVSIRPEHPLMVHAMNFIIERVADHTKKSLQWKDLSKTRDPDNFVHVTTGPGVWTEAVADYFGLECCVEALSLVNILERNGGKIISANGVEGFVVGASQSIEPPAKDGNVCVFRSDFFGGGLLGNGYMSQWPQEELTEKQEAGEDTSGSWGSWTREADIFKFFSDLFLLAFQIPATHWGTGCGRRGAGPLRTRWGRRAWCSETQSPGPRRGSFRWTNRRRTWCATPQVARGCS